MTKKILSYVLVSFLTLCALLAGSYAFLAKREEPVGQQEIQQRLLRLKDKVAVITGASGGIGLALAREAAKYKMKIVLSDINSGPSDDFAELVRRRGGQALSIRADLLNEQDRKKLIAETISEFGRIDYLFNNAGYHYVAKPIEIDVEAAKKMFEVNFFAVVDLTQQALVYMKRENSGTIVNITSILSHFPTVSELGQNGLNSLYAASKGALYSWSDVIKNGTRKYGVSVKVSSPAGTKTDFWRNAQGPQKALSIKQANELWHLYDEPETIAQDTFAGMVTDRFLILPGNANIAYKSLKASENFFGRLFD